jgi:arylsulfatase A-like enzyme
MTNRPNVVLISIDTLRADHLSCYGYQKKTTPHLDSLAEEGSVFLQHYSTGVWTPPGHASMLTGLYVSEHGVHGERSLREDIPTIAEKLKACGYQTAGFVNNSQVGALVGLDRGHDTFEEVWRGIKPSEVMKRALMGLLRRAMRALGREDMGARITNRLFRHWIERKTSRDRPFYAFLHYIEPHNPLEPPRPYKGKYGGKAPAGIDLKKVGKVAHNPLICFVEKIELSGEEIEYLKSLYDGEIAYTDMRVGEVVKVLKKNGLYDNTAIIVTSDHGEHFGEWGLWSHVASLHREVLRIPLIIKYPRGSACSGEIDGYTQLVDIFPTVMDVAGVSRESGANTSGVSLAPGSSGRFHDYVYAEWEGRIPFFIQSKVLGKRDPVPLGKITTKMCMVQDRTHKYILKSDGSEELYEISDGREERSEDAAKSETLRGMIMKRKNILNDKEEAGLYRMDSDIAKNLRSLGYM